MDAKPFLEQLSGHLRTRKSQALFPYEILAGKRPEIRCE